MTTVMTPALIDEKGVVSTDKALEATGGVMATVFFDGIIKRPVSRPVDWESEEGETFDKPCIRPEIPEPKVCFGRVLRDRLRHMDYDDRQKFVALFEGLRSKFAQDIRKFITYVDWLYTPRSQEIRCEHCNALYTGWSKEDERWSDGDPMLNGWCEVQIPVDPNNDSDEHRSAIEDGFDTVFIDLCAKCLKKHDKPTKKLTKKKGKK